MKRAVLPTPPADELLIVRDALVPKLSARSAGSKIGYKLGCTLDKSEVYLSLTVNQGGGYFSHEWVPLSRIIDKLKSLVGDGPFPAITLKSVMVGKSVNNASFLAAALVAEGVLKPEADKAFKLQIACDPVAWRDGLFDLPGEVESLRQPAIEEAKGGQNAESSSEPDSQKKSKRGARVKTGLADDSDSQPDTGAEANHANHPQPE